MPFPFLAAASLAVTAASTIGNIVNSTSHPEVEMALSGYFFFLKRKSRSKRKLYIL